MTVTAKTGGTLATCTFRNFDLTISNQSAPYTVNAHYQDRTAEGQFFENSRQPLWKEWLPLLDQNLPSSALIEEVGGHLYQSLFQGEIERLWQRALAVQGDTNNHRLRLRLTINPPEVSALPWESLYNPRGRRLLATDSQITVTRTASRSDFVESLRALQTPAPLTILIIAIDTADALSVEDEAQRIETMLADHVPHTARIVREKGPVELNQLRRLLDQHQPDILHIMTHGTPEHLLFWQNGAPIFVRAAQIQAALAENRSVKLVFLNACLAGRSDDSRPFGSVAHHLMQNGIPAVIAMQFYIEDRVAVDFAGFVYESLVHGPCMGIIDSAVSAARNSLFIQDPDLAGHINPVLWLNAADGRILQIDTAKTPEHPQSKLNETPPPPEIDLGIVEKEAWLAALPKEIPSIGLNRRYQSLKRNAADTLDLLRQLEARKQDGESVPLHILRQQLTAFETLRTPLDNLAALASTDD